MDETWVRSSSRTDDHVWESDQEYEIGERAETVMHFVIGWKRAHDGNSPRLAEIAKACQLSIYKVYQAFTFLEEHGRLVHHGEGVISIKAGKWIGPYDEVEVLPTGSRRPAWPKSLDQAAFLGTLKRLDRPHLADATEERWIEYERAYIDAYRGVDGLPPWVLEWFDEINAKAERKDDDGDGNASIKDS